MTKALAASPLAPASWAGESPLAAAIPDSVSPGVTRCDAPACAAAGRAHSETTAARTGTGRRKSMSITLPRAGSNRTPRAGLGPLARWCACVSGCRRRCAGAWLAAQRPVHETRGTRGMRGLAIDDEPATRSVVGAGAIRRARASDEPEPSPLELPLPLDPLPELESVDGVVVVGSGVGAAIVTDEPARSSPEPRPLLEPELSSGPLPLAPGVGDPLSSSPPEDPLPLPFDRRPSRRLPLPPLPPRPCLPLSPSLDPLPLRP